MTVSTPTNKAFFNGTGSQTTFDIPFLFFENADIIAILRDANGVETNWVEGTHYTLVGAGEETGRTLTVETLPVDYTPQTGETLLIKRVEQLTQPINFPAGGAIPSAAMEEGLDRLTMLVQQVDETLSRTFTVPASDPVAGTVFPSNVSRANKYLAFDAGGVPIAAAPPEGGNIVSAFMATMLDDADAGAARGTLGLIIGTDVLAPDGDGSQLTGITDPTLRAEIDTIRANIALLGFRQATSHALSVQNIIDGVVDEFEDETGINTISSLNEVYVSPEAAYTNGNVLAPKSSSASEWAGDTGFFTFAGSNISIVVNDHHIRSKDVLIGDFEFQFTIPAGGVGKPRGVGVYAISEDTVWGPVSGAAAVGFTNAWTLNKHNPSTFFTVYFGDTSQGTTHTPSAGEIHKIKRVGGVFSFLVNDVVKHTWSQQYSGPVRITLGTNNLDGIFDAVSWLRSTGLRISEGTGTALGDMINGGGVTKAFDGTFNVAVASSTEFVMKSVTSSPAYVGKDWGAGNEKVLSHMVVYGLTDRGYVGGAAASPSVTITLEGSTDNFATSIVSLGSMTFTDSDAINTTAVTATDTTTAYRYHRAKITHASGATEPTNCAEVQFMEKPSVNNMSLISNSFVAQSQPIEASIVIWEEDIDPVTPGTDIAAKVSRDGGTTYTTVSLSEDAVLTTGRLLTGKVSISSQPVGTSMVYKITTPGAVPKEQRIHGVSMQWR